MACRHANQRRTSPTQTARATPTPIPALAPGESAGDDVEVGFGGEVPVEVEVVAGVELGWEGVALGEEIDELAVEVYPSPMLL